MLWVLIGAVERGGGQSWFFKQKRKEDINKRKEEFGAGKTNERLTDSYLLNHSITPYLTSLEHDYDPWCMYLELEACALA